MATNRTPPEPLTEGELTIAMNALVRMIELNARTAMMLEDGISDEAQAVLAEESLDLMLVWNGLEAQLAYLQDREISHITGMSNDERATAAAEILGGYTDN